MSETFPDLLALVEQDGFRALARSTSRGGQYNGPCPWCGGRDRFRVQPHHGSYGWFACNVCGRKGSAVDYLMLKRGLSKREALLMVGWQPADGAELRLSLPASALEARPAWDEPSECWQEAAWDFARACRDTLWSPAGRAALDYLRGRGFSDATIRAAMLGYHAREEYGPASVWGQSRPLKLWQGVVIPWTVIRTRQLWRLTIRDERVSEGVGRYRQVAGGSNGLYLSDTLSLHRPCTVLTEGEFDALAVAQVCGREVAVVASGTTQGGHTPRWLSLLSRQERVLVAFDGEEKGDLAANWWLSRLPNAQRLRPWSKDANVMLSAGLDLAAWIASATVR